MKIRKFVAPSVPQALRQVRDDLGEQAVILNTRQIPGEGGRQHVEITAAHDSAPVATAAAAPVATVEAPAQGGGDLLGRTYGRSAPARSAPARSAPARSAPEPPDSSRGSVPLPSRQGPRWTEDRAAGQGADPRSRRSLTDRSGADRPGTETAAWLASLPSVADQTRYDDATAETENVTPRRDHLPSADTSTAQTIDHVPGQPTAGMQHDSEPKGAPVMRRLRQIEDAVRHMARHSSSLELPPEVARLGERLRRVGVNEDLTRALLPKVLRRVQEESLDCREAVVKTAAELLYEMLPERADLRIGRSRKVVAFVGPSGSGKTTAIAKIAAGFVKRRQRRPDFSEGEIAIISTDTQRVGALAQARAYAELIGVPLEDAHDADDLAQTLERHANARLVLIDTAGIGAHEVKQREQLRTLLDTAAVDEVQVVLDGRTGYDYMLDLLEVCDGEQPRRLLLSKMDEAMHPGAALSAAISGTMPSSFFTTGPAIPGGIAPGDLRRLVDWVVGRCPSPFTPDGTAGSEVSG